MDAKASAFQLKEYKIQKMVINAPGENVTPETTTLLYFANCDVTRSDHGWTGNIAIGLKIAPKDEADTTLLETVIVGTFMDGSDDTPENKERFEKLLKLSGATTLIPIARAAACSAVSIMGYHGKLIIPNINVYTLNWNEQQSE